jgi:hypothetical protein
VERLRDGLDQLLYQRGADRYLLDQVRERMGFPDTRAFVGTYIGPLIQAAQDWLITIRSQSACEGPSRS